MYVDSFLLQYILVALVMALACEYTLTNPGVWTTNTLKVLHTKKLEGFLQTLTTHQVSTMALYPLISWLLMMILSSNFFGMMPYTMTLTSQILMTLVLALVLFTSMNIIYVIKQKVQSFALFLPNGTPLFMAPFLMQMEMVSYLSRVISLSVRLFANMTSGHTLLKMLSGFVVGLMSAGSVGMFVSSFPLMMIFMVTGLELLIAGLQAYVFLILFLIYLHELEAGDH